MYKQHPTLKYYVSDRGIVMKSRGCGEKKLAISKAGYVSFPYNGKSCLVHRMVYETFCGAIPDGYQINHINGIKTDNRIENLEVVTPKENIHHAYEMGLKSPKYAECNGQAKLTNNQYYELIGDIINGLTNDEIAAKYGLHSRYVSLVRGKKRLNSIWEKYESENGKKVIPQSGGKSALCLESRIQLLRDLESMSNKEIAYKLPT